MLSEGVDFVREERSTAISNFLHRSTLDFENIK
jgi:hypothetical protein